MHAARGPVRAAVEDRGPSLGTIFRMSASVRQFVCCRARLVALLASALLALLGPGRAMADDPPVKIGIVYSYTGSSPAAGQALDASIAAWLAMHGNLVGGRKVELIRRDDTGPAPDVARRMAQELVVQDHVDFLMGSIFTPNAVAIKQVSTAAKVPFFIINAATNGIIADAPYTVRFGATIYQNTAPLAMWAARNGIRHVYTIVSDYAPGIESAKVFAQTLTAGGGTIVGDVRAPVTATDFSAYVQRIQDAKPQAAFAFVVAGPPAVAFFKAARDASAAGAGFRTITNGATVDELDLPSIGDAALGVISCAQYEPTHRSALNDAYLAAFAKVAPAGVPVPDFMAEAGFDVLSAIDRVVAAQKGPLDPDKAMTTLRGLKLESPRGPIQIDAQTRELTQNLYIRRVEKRGTSYVNQEIDTFPNVAGAAP
jgi:branched-chain amino acid transport system substrate-binding protein